MLLAVALLLALGPAFPARQASAQVTILQGTTISKATLYVYATGRRSVDIVNVHRITAAWAESSVTWNSFAGSYDSTIVGSFENADGWQSVDVTSLVQAWVNGTTPNYGLLLEQNGTPYTTYNSSEYSDVSLRPKLEICYSGSCTTIQRPGVDPASVVDAYIWQQVPDYNSGGSPTLYTGVVDVTNKQSLIRFDFSLVLPASLGDFVWSDLNHNGIQDAGEPGVPSVPVHLYASSDGTLLASTVTDANGKYLFSNLMPGTYYVVFDKGGYAYFSPQYQGTDQALDSNASLSTGQTENITLSSGQSNLTVDAGLYQPTTSPGTGTPGYWMNHPSAWPGWPNASIVIGGRTYGEATAIANMKAPTAKDVTYTMFQALVSAKLNLLIGNDSSCIASIISAADAWMATYPVGSGVKAGGSTSPWRVGEPLYETLDLYNNGGMCAPHRN